MWEEAVKGCGAIDNNNNNKRLNTVFVLWSYLTQKYGTCLMSITKIIMNKIYSDSQLFVVYLNCT